MGENMITVNGDLHVFVLTNKKRVPNLPAGLSCPSNGRMCGRSKLVYDLR